MNILLTGATGFIGRHLVRELIALGHTVHAIVRPSSKSDILPCDVKLFRNADDSLLLAEYVNDNSIHGVIHLASLFLSSHKPRDIPSLIDSNILFPTKVLEALSFCDSGIWFMNTGTVWQHFNNDQYNPVNLYSATKQSFEDIAKYYYEAFKIKFVTIKLSDTYGPGDTRPKIFNLLKTTFDEGGVIDMSEGEQIIDICFIDDVVKAYVLLLEYIATSSSSINGKSYVVSASKVFSLKQLVHIYEQSLGVKLSINWGKRPYRPREVMRPYSNGEKVPGWKSLVSLEQGIIKTFGD